MLPRVLATFFLTSLLGCLPAEGPQPPTQVPTPITQLTSPTQSESLDAVPVAELTSAQEEVMISGQIEPGDATHIVGLPLRRGRVALLQGDTELPTFPVDRDGTFAVPLVRDGRDWLLAVVDMDNQEGGEGAAPAFLGFLSLGVSPVEGLIIFPSRLLNDDIDLGDVETGGDETFSSKGAAENSESLAMSADRIAERAKVDDVLRQAKRYIAAGLKGEAFAPLPPLSYGWTAQPLQKIVNQWSSPDPHSYGSALKSSGTPDAAAPTSSDGHARVYVPSLRVVSDATSHTASRLELQWYFYDRSLPAALGGPAYVPADNKTFLETVHTYHVSWGDARHTNPLSWNDPADDVDFEPHAWSLDADAAPSVTVSYNVAGVTYSWRWKASAP